MAHNRPSRDAVAITTSDTAQTNTFEDVYVGGTGDVKVTTEAGTDVTFKAMPVGYRIGVRVTRVFATGTSATLLVGYVP